jgi:prepilin-type N-terminal cleavage/methylation domain-containing protein
MRLKWKNPHRPNMSGFTLIEGVIAMALGAIMFAGVYAGLGWGFAIVQADRANLRATQILVKRAEGIRLCTFDQITDTNYNPATFTEYFDPKDQSGGGGGTVYSGSCSATVPSSGSLPDSYRTNMLLVTLGVSWTTGKTPHSRSLQTYVAQNGIESYVSMGR